MLVENVLSAGVEDMTFASRTENLLVDNSTNPFKSIDIPTTHVTKLNAAGNDLIYLEKGE